MNTKKEKLLYDTYQSFIDQCLGRIKPDALYEILSEEAMGFGTTADEKIFGIEDFLKLLRIQKEQSEGLDMNWEINAVSRYVNADENLAVFADDLHLNVAVNGEKIKMHVRISVVLENKNNKWIVIHWHGSKPEDVQSEEDTYGIENWKQKVEKLEKIVAERTADLVEKNRELEIETSLEKIRAVAMSMMKPDDLLNICQIQFNELSKLGFTEIRNALIEIFNDEKKYFTDYDYSDFSGGAITQIPYNKNSEIDKAIKQMKTATDAFTETVVKGKELEEWKAFRQKNGEYEDPRLNDITALYYYFYSVKAGSVGISTFKKITEQQLLILKRIRNVFDLAYQRYTDISLAETQAREAQIEVALERVRARAMSMQHSEELADAASILFQQIKALGFETWSCGFCIWKENDKVEVWMGTDSGGLLPPMMIPLKKEPTHHDIYKASLTGVDSHEKIWEGKALEKHYNFLRKLPSVAEAIKQLEDAGLSLPTKQCYYVGFFNQGYLLLITKEPNVEMGDISKRFTKVFEQAYTRFLDLQKAEAQSREAQIELALERVRARTMAMQHSDELADASLLLDQQIRGLGIKTRGCAFNIYGEKDSTEWFSNEMGTMHTYKTPREKVFLRYYEAGQKGETLLIKEFSGKECVDWYNYLCTLPVIGDGLKEMIANGGSFPTRQIDHVSFFKYGYLLFLTFEPVPEFHEIFKRFAKVFEQTYTRFLDLQKAEAQTREAQINLAVERVRARALAMFKSDEILEVVFKLKEEVMNLDIPGVAAATIHLKEKNGMHRMWDLSSLEENGERMHLPLDVIYKLEESDPNFYLRKIWGNDQKYFLIKQDRKDLKITTNWLRSNGKVKQADEADQFLDSFDFTYLYHPTIQLNNGRMSIDLVDQLPSEEMESILTKMGAAFDLAYKRFEDLKNSEAQLKEAQIEAALEKVRSRSLAMHKSEEIGEVVWTVVEKMKDLNVELNGISLVTYIPDSKDTLHWHVNPEVANNSSTMLLPYFDDLICNDCIEAKEKGIELLAKVYTKAQKDSYFNKAVEVSDFKNFPEELKKWVLEKPCLSFSFAIQNHSGIFLEDYDGKIFSKEENDILTRFSKVFEQSYVRFLDLQKAESQALQAVQSLIEIKMARQKAEEALSDLQAAQKQLVQSEKMASLGELTAGIAHEIQNPLNFVNNFSEVSKELLDEMRDALEKGDTEEAKEIMNDVIQNLEKINHHGKRADAIVKGMLQHSQSSMGQKQPTDINALCDEYLRLSYHGLRAKDKSFNATIKTDFDESIGKINIIPQDIGRVILNLINNAFYAVDEKKKSGIENFEPTVSVSTKKINSKIEISVSDNGNGIHQNIVDKIFQPFFTTKPTGQGTGLGLSLSYDIVKAHGGEIKVESKEKEARPDEPFGRGTTFIIQLPTT